MPTLYALGPPPSRLARVFSNFAVAVWGALGALFFASCSPPIPEPEPAPQVAASDWRRIEQDRHDLLAQRSRLTDSATRAPEAEATADLRREVERRADDLSRRLVSFLNDDPPRENEALSPRQVQAIRWKSEEDIHLARGYVERAGDHRRAIDILEAALALDPGFADLRGELERIRAARFVSPERFAKVKNGMNADQVREILGAPNPHNVRQYLERGPGHGVIGWFYPKDDRGAAAGVWFAAEQGTPVVYRTDFSAIQPEGESRPGETGAPPAEPPIAPAAAGRPEAG